MPRSPQAPAGTNADATKSATPATTSVAPTAKPSAPAANSKSILIVEDERPLSHALEMKLKNQGYTTTVVVNGQDALDALHKGSYDLVLMDLIMPVMDGFALLTAIRDEKLKAQVIVLSNLGQDEDRAKKKELGAIDYFVKSNTPIADIMRRVQQALA